MIDEATRRFVRDRAVLPFHVEHIRAYQHRGTDDLENLCWACSRCNRLKGPNLSAYDPLTDQLIRLFDPRHDAWEEHFKAEGAFLIGLTAEGRATVELLQMNELWRVRLRAALRNDP